MSRRASYLGRALQTGLEVFVEGRATQRREINRDRIDLYVLCLFEGSVEENGEARHLKRALTIAVMTAIQEARSARQKRREVFRFAWEAEGKYGGKVSGTSAKAARRSEETYEH